MNEYIKNLSLIEVVEISGSSERLKNAIRNATNSHTLPFSTIGSFLKWGNSAYEQIIELPNIGEKSITELTLLIDYLTTDKLEKLIDKTNTLIINLDNKYKILFSPLVKRYEFALKNVESPYEKLACIKYSNLINNILCETKQHAEIIGRRVLGETLDSIGNDFGITRERVRQISASWTEFTLSQKEWLLCIIDNLLENSDSQLPCNKTLFEINPMFQYSLAKVFLDTDLGSYWSKDNRERVKLYFEKNTNNLSPEGRYELAKVLNLECDHELEYFTRWTLDRIIYETKQAAIKLGTLHLMPKQKELIELGYSNLRGAITRFGGQSKVADLAGLEYQGQMVAPDGKRKYWTNRRIKIFLNKVAKIEGHPGIIPTQAECKKHAPVPGTVIANITHSSSKKQKTLSWKDVAALHELKLKSK